MKPRPSAADAAAPAVTRARIQHAAAELYLRHGHDGISFAEIAAAVVTTRPNVHYHFGTKRQLMAALVEDFTLDAEARIARNWTTPGHSLARRLRNQVEDFRHFYARFNARPGDRNVWSPIARLRLDLPVLGEVAAQALARVNAAHERCLGHAVAEAIESGELRRQTDATALVRLLRAIIGSCGPMTQDTGSFAVVEHLFAAVSVTIAAAWAPRPAA